MRFCDLFTQYKIGLKGINNTIPFTKLPLHRKIFAIIMFASLIITGIWFAISPTWKSFIPVMLGGLAFIVFLIIDSTQKKMNDMLENNNHKFNVTIFLL